MAPGFASIQCGNVSGWASFFCRRNKHKKVKATYNFKKKEQLEKVDNIEGIKVVYPEFLSDGKKYLEYILYKKPLIISI